MTKETEKNWAKMTNEVFTENPDTKLVFCIYADKGEGKTTHALGFPGKKYVLSFDRKTQRIKKYIYNDSDNIVVVDMIKYFSSKKEEYLTSCVDTYQLILKVLDEIGKRGDADWIIFDGLELVIEMCEMVMRYDHGLLPFQGISNMAVWKDRKLNVRLIHEKAFFNCKAGIVYTTYCAKDEIVEDAQIITKKDVPHYIDIIMYQVDVVMHATIELDRNHIPRYMLHTKTSKVPMFKTGETKDMTNKTIADTYFTQVQPVLPPKEEEKLLNDMFT